MGLSGSNEKELTEALVSKLHEFNKLMGIPSPSAYGIDKEKYMSLLSNMADAAIASGSPGNNPKVFTKEELMELYKKAYA
jgi:alcohol dehydrogenase class IV